MNVNGFIKKHSSQLRTISEIVGGGLIIYFTASGTVKAVRKVDAYKAETGRDDLSTKELFQLCWKCYVPAATALASTVTVSAVSEHITRNAHKEQIKGLETAYNLVKSTAQLYSEKVAETIGEEKEAAIKEEVKKERSEMIKNNPSMFLASSNDRVLCVDSFGREFETTVAMIENARNKANEVMIKCDYISLNDFYGFLGLSTTKMGDDLGWNTFSTGLIEIAYDATLVNGRPALSIGYYVEPRPDYSKFS